VLLYSLDEDHASVGAQNALIAGRTLKLPVYQVASENATIVGSEIQQIRAASPDEWVRLFRNAAAIVTDSFHGCAFSIKFRRPFVAYTSGRRAARLEDLLNTHGLARRLIFEGHASPELYRSYFDDEMNSIAARLESLVTESSAFLKKALADE
jgi:hypothetical protein